MANVSRNSLYRYHPEVLSVLRDHPDRRGSGSPGAADTRPALNAELAILHDQVPMLAALVDHYYAAYSEAQALLRRRDPELAELRRRIDSKVIRLAR
jgi:hypothetical protein